MLLHNKNFWGCGSNLSLILKQDMQREACWLNNIWYCNYKIQKLIIKLYVIYLFSTKWFSKCRALIKPLITPGNKEIIPGGSFSLVYHQELNRNCFPIITIFLSNCFVFLYIKKSFCHSRHILIEFTRF